MQTQRQSRFEVGIDLLISLLANIGAQILFYGQLATAGRSLSLAVIILTPAVPRRYLIRLLFNARLAPGARQSRWHCPPGARPSRPGAALHTLGTRRGVYS